MKFKQSFREERHPYCFSTSKMYSDDGIRQLDINFFDNFLPTSPTVVQTLF